MSFAHPHLLHFLWLAFVLAGVLYWLNRRREKILARFVEAHLVNDILLRFSRRRHHVKMILLVAVFVFAVLALARPQWGFEWREVKREGLDILLVVDTSKSMLTQDVKPNRLERTKLAVKDMIKRLKGDRIGLVAFAGDAFLVCPLTVDYSGFLLSLDDLGVDTIPRGGTNLARAIEEATKGYTQTAGKYKAVVLVTDGDNVEGDPMDAAKQAKEKGIKVFCVGIGTKEGDLIQVTSDAGQKEFLKDSDGNIVKSRLNENVLQQIASATGGAYVRSSGAQFGLDTIYEDYLSKLEKRDIEEKMEKKYHERFQIPLAIALLLLILETVITTGKNK